MADVTPELILRRAMRLVALVPDQVLDYMEDFAGTRKTGQMTLNYLEGLILTADVREHIKIRSKKNLDTAEPSL
jgi:hypothetical protein